MFSPAGLQSSTNRVAPVHQRVNALGGPKGTSDVWKGIRRDVTTSRGSAALMNQPRGSRITLFLDVSRAIRGIIPQPALSPRARQILSTRVHLK